MRISFLFHSANEGPVKILYKCLVPIYIFPEIKLLFPKQNYNVLSPSSFTHISVRDLYPGSVCLFWADPGNMYVFKSLTDTWMWKLGLRPCNSQKMNTYVGFSLQCKLEYPEHVSFYYEHDDDSYISLCVVLCARRAGLLWLHILPHPPPPPPHPLPTPSSLDACMVNPKTKF